MDKLSNQKLPLLKGFINYEIQFIKTKATIIKEGYEKALTEEVGDNLFVLDNNKALATLQLLCTKEPLLHIKGKTSCKKAWKALEDHYKPLGFIIEFLLLREFFNSFIEDFNFVEEYLNKVKFITNELKLNKVELLNKVIIAWVLNSLLKEFESFV